MNVNNWLKYGEQELRGSDIRFDCLHVAILSFFYNLFRFAHITVKVMDIVTLVLFLFLGFRAKGKKVCLDSFLYRGVANMVIAIRYYMFSWLFLVYSGADPGIVSSIYTILFIALSVCYGCLTKRNVSKNVFSGDHKSHAGWAGLLGATLSVSLCPILFANVTQNGAYIIIAVCTLFLGAAMHCAIVSLFKFAFLLKQNHKSEIKPV